VLFVISCERDQVLAPPPLVLSGCDTTHIGFAAVIQPTFDTACVGCHGSSGGVTLSNYNSIASVIASGRLVPAMQGSMRQYITDCQIAKILAWINKGHPNN
jgi:hypothetical protein